MNYEQIGLSRTEAVDRLARGLSVTFVHLDATLRYWMFEPVFLEDGDLVYPHPTQPRGTARVPDDAKLRAESWSDSGRDCYGE